MTAPRELWAVRDGNGEYYLFPDEEVRARELAAMWDRRDIECAPHVVVRLYEHPPVAAPSPDDELRRLRDAVRALADALLARKVDGRTA